MRDLSDRIAGAPISWGVCEVPGWGWQPDAAMVLEQMHQVGLLATELGPAGFLPDGPEAKSKALADKGLRAVGGFVPVVLHDPDHDPLPEVELALEGLAAAGAGTLVVAAATGTGGYDVSPVLDEAGWLVLLTNLDQIARVASRRAITATVHPHVGTMVETAEDVEHVLAGSSVGLCLDTGHLLIGGVDPVALAAEHAGRIRHTHLKDVDATWARRVQSGEVSYTAAVRGGMYRPLGQGDVDIAAIVGSLENSGYDGWYVLEHDTILAGPPAHGDGPVADVGASIEHLLAISRSLR
ncbi:MAG: sugar phosphate isomerase/epimerase [Dermatophilaceae bacterium]